MNQLDLVGTSGLSIFCLTMRNALTHALRHPNAGASRVAVTGLSGGGWQTILLSALDTRVKLAVPVAGYSSFATRAAWPDLDLGDSRSRRLGADAGGPRCSPTTRRATAVSVPLTRWGRNM